MIVRYFALIFLYCISALVSAQNAPLCPTPISFALYEIGYLYEASSNSGIDKDVAEELGKRSGCRFEFTLKSRARIWAELKSGQLMMSGSGIQTAKRDAFAWFVPYMALKNYVVLASSLELNTAAQFAANPKLLWGAVRSFKHGETADAFLEKLRQDSRVMEESDVLTIFRIFALPQRTSAILALPPAYAKYIKELGLASRTRIEDWFPEDQAIPHGLIFSKKFFSAAEIKKWRALIEQMRTDGTLKAIYQKYLSVVDAERMLQYKANE